jgi:hypothetical protein
MFLMKKIQLFVLLFFCLTVCLHAQVHFRIENYYDVKPGVYTTKSILKIENLDVVCPQIILTNKPNVCFIHLGNHHHITLFSEIPNDDLLPVAILKENSIVEVDTVFYLDIFDDATIDWHITFNVWYEIKINGRKYHTDYKPHDFMAFKTTLDIYDQTFLIVAQSTGYDYYYNNGYLNHFFAVVIDSENKIVFTSSILDVDFNDEYWKQEGGAITTKFENGEFSFTIIGDRKKISAKWDGKSFVEVKN